MKINTTTIKKKINKITLIPLFDKGIREVNIDAERLHRKKISFGGKFNGHIFRQNSDDINANRSGESVRIGAENFAEDIHGPSRGVNLRKINNIP